MHVRAEYSMQGMHRRSHANVRAKPNSWSANERGAAWIGLTMGLLVFGTRGCAQ